MAVSLSTISAVRHRVLFVGEICMIKALVFDFDGLLVDTESSSFTSWQEIYQEYACDLALDVWAAVLGGSGQEFDPCAHLAKLIGQAVDADALRARRRQRKLELAAHATLLPGIAEALIRAKHLSLRLAVASSSSRQWVVGHLNRLQVTEYFDTIVCADDVTQVKPDPALYCTAVARLGVQASEAVAIEDAFVGLCAAKAAGLACVVVPNRFTQPFDFRAADLRLRSFADMSLDELLTHLQHLTVQ
jgi:HAD superfamily hydrolase (TIGR01509 family)